MDQSALLAIALLGGFRITMQGNEMPATAWGQRRAAAVIKLLALAPDGRMHREEVMAALWPDLEERAAANNLRVALYRARHTLEEAGAVPGSVLVREGDQLRLALTPIWIDVAAFETAVARSWRDGSPGAATEALALYRGDLLPDELYEEWAADRRTALRTSYLAMLAHLAQLQEARGEVRAAIETLQQLVARDPLDAQAHAALMRLFAVMGEPHQAVRQFEHLTRVMEQELGAEPEPATRALLAEIREGRIPAGPSPSPSVSHMSASEPDQQKQAPRPVIPALLDTTVGREREIAEVERLLTRRRLLTLIGPAGVGKTRLATEIAQRAAATGNDEVAFVELAPLQHASLVLPTVARALGLVETGNDAPIDTIAAYVGDTPWLIVLDNFEHVVSAGPMVVEFLTRCPRARLLITSRGRLNIRGEHGYPVSPLATPAPRDEIWPPASPGATETFPAVELFIERARAIRPHLKLSEHDLQTMGEICRLLDGLPLAIELAAARMRLLTPAALLTHLDRRLATLTGGPADAPARQQTLRAAIAWSYDLLSPAEQSLFARLSVFAGGFSLDGLSAMEGGKTARRQDGKMEDGGRRMEDGGSAVTHSLSPVNDHPSPYDPDTPTPRHPDTLGLLSALVEQSLVQMRDDEEGEPRYSMLETIREFATEQLEAAGEARAFRQRHATFFLGLAEAAAPNLTGLDAPGWFNRLERDHDNLRAALDTFTAEDDGDGLLRLSGALWRFWWQRGYLSEGRAHLTRALDMQSSVAGGTRANALDGCGVLAAAQGDLALATEMHGDALRLWRAAGDRFGEVRALTNLGLVADEGGDPRRAATLLQEALNVAQSIGDRRGSAVALANLGQVAITVGDHDLAISLLSESVAIFRALGDQRDTAAILANLGVVAFLNGDFARARLCHEEALALFRTFGDRQAEADELLNLGHTVQQEGDLARAGALFDEAHAMFIRLGDRSGEAFALSHQGRLAHLRGNTTDAERLLLQGVALAERTGDRVALIEGWEALANVACALGDVRWCAHLIGAAAALREETGVPLPAVHRPALSLAQETALAALGHGPYSAAITEGRVLALAGTALHRLLGGNHSPAGTQANGFAM